MLIKESLTELLNDLREETLFASCRHSYCKSVNEEINDLKVKGMVDATQIENQWQRYVEWGFKDDLEISENGLLVRRYNDARRDSRCRLRYPEESKPHRCYFSR